MRIPLFIICARIAFPALRTIESSNLEPVKCKTKLFLIIRKNYYLLKNCNLVFTYLGTPLSVCSPTHCMGPNTVD